MEQLKERFLRPCRKLTDQFLIAWVIAFVLIQVGSVVYIAGVFAAHFVNTESMPSSVSWAMDNYYAFSGILVVFVLVMAVVRDDRPMLRRLVPTLRKGNTVWRFFLGLLAGFACNGICVAISVLRHDIALSFVGVEVIPLLVILVGVLIQSGAEELVARLYLQQKLLRRYKGPVVAVFLSALFFMLLHVANPGFGVVSLVQLALVGVIFSLFCLYFDAFGAAVGMHTAWNFTQNIIFGLPNSGLVSEYSIFRLEAAANGPFFDTIFGVEGGFGSCFVLGAFLVALVVYIKVKGIKPVDMWADAEAKAAGSQAGATASAAPRHMAK